MSVSNEYLEYVVDQLGRVGAVTHRRMFGGVGLYLDGLFFALIDDDTLYFKVDDETRDRYLKARSKPFQPYGEESYSMGYYQVPADILEDDERLRVWATEAAGVAARKASGGKTRGKASARKRR
jgi:DNA transformation protein